MAFRRGVFCAARPTLGYFPELRPNLTKQRRARRALYSTAADRSASSAVIRVSLSFHALISAAKARSTSSVERRLAAVDVPPPRCPSSTELAPAAVAAPAASPPPAATVAPAVGSSPLRASITESLSRHRCHLAPPRRCATAAHHRHRRAPRRHRRFFRHCASSSSYLWSRARGAPWEDVSEGHYAVLVVRISIAIWISTLGVKMPSSSSRSRHVPSRVAYTSGTCL